MKLAVDTTSDKLADVLRVVGATYGVEVAVQGEPPVSRRPVGSGLGVAELAVTPWRRLVVRSGWGWAKDNGWEVGGRGALPRTVAAAYREAHGGA